MIPLSLLDRPRSLSELELWVSREFALKSGQVVQETPGGILQGCAEFLRFNLLIYKGKEQELQPPEPLSLQVVAIQLFSACVCCRVLLYLVSPVSSSRKRLLQITLEVMKM